MRENASEHRDWPVLERIREEPAAHDTLGGGDLPRQKDCPESGAQAEHRPLRLGQLGVRFGQDTHRPSVKVRVTLVSYSEGKRWFFAGHAYECGNRLTITIARSRTSLILSLAIPKSKPLAAPPSLNHIPIISLRLDIRSSASRLV